MWKNKKVILIALLVVVIAAGTAVVAFAQSGNGDQTATPTPTQDRVQTLLDKVGQIYQQNTGTALDTVQLKTAFEQAGKEMQTDAMNTYLKGLVDKGKITQAQADEYAQWMQSKPADLSGSQLPGMGFGGGMRGGRGGHGPCW
jgi:type VI protein secretion system component VasK